MLGRETLSRLAFLEEIVRNIDPVVVLVMLVGNSSWDCKVYRKERDRQTERQS